MDEQDAVKQAEDIVAGHAYRTLQAEAMLGGLGFIPSGGTLTPCYRRLADGAYALTSEYAEARAADPAGASRTYAWMQTSLMTEVGRQALHADPRAVAEEFDRLMLSQPPQSP